MVGFGVLYSAMRFMPEKSNWEIIVLFVSETTFLEFVSYILLFPIMVVFALYIFYKIYTNKP
jgi:hypothetical protein